MTTGVKVFHDPRAHPNRIARFMHCGKCVASVPSDESPQSWARLEVGLTDKGEIQVWCVRHQESINVMGFVPSEGLEYPEGEPVGLPACQHPEHEPDP